MSQKRRIFLLLAGGLFIQCGCGNPTSSKSVSDSGKSLADSNLTARSSPMNAEAAKNAPADSTKYQYSYLFENDSSVQQLYVSKGRPGKQKDEPGSLKFKLILKDKFDSHRDITLEGTANLKSPNESFTDTSSKDGGDYAAADYSYNLNGCSLSVRIDVEKFQACVLHSECDQFKRFIKRYPDYDILKRRENL